MGSFCTRFFFVFPFRQFFTSQGSQAERALGEEKEEKMVKLDVTVLRYLTKEDFRVLTSIEQGMKNHEVFVLFFVFCFLFFVFCFLFFVFCCLVFLCFSFLFLSFFDASPFFSLLLSLSFSSSFFFLLFFLLFLDCFLFLTLKHQLVPTDMIPAIACLKKSQVKASLSQLHKHKLLFHEARKCLSFSSFSFFFSLV